MTYAKDTSVAPERSRAEIERILQRYGATKFMYGWDEAMAVVGFHARDRQIRFVLAMPDPRSSEFTLTPKRGTTRSPEAAHQAWEQACRQRWRALALVIKAKLEACEAGISEFEDEFMANIILPDNRTVADFMRPQIEAAYRDGTMPKLLPDLS